MPIIVHMATWAVTVRVTVERYVLRILKPSFIYEWPSNHEFSKYTKIIPER